MQILKSILVAGVLAGVTGGAMSLAYAGDAKKKMCDKDGKVCTVAGPDCKAKLCKAEKK